MLLFYFLKDERAFSEEEEEKLQGAFVLESDDLHVVLETCAFILEQVIPLLGLWHTFCAVVKCSLLIERASNSIAMCLWWLGVFEGWCVCQEIGSWAKMCCAVVA